jgi:hypothetical protein
MQTGQNEPLWELSQSLPAKREQWRKGAAAELRICLPLFVGSPDGGTSFREIVRQQWNFSPPETIREDEEYQVELSNVTVLELIIVPNMSSGAARASLKNLRLS